MGSDRKFTLTLERWNHPVSRTVEVVVSRGEIPVDGGREEVQRKVPQESGVCVVSSTRVSPVDRSGKVGESITETVGHPESVRGGYSKLTV